MSLTIVLNRNGEWIHIPVGLDAPGNCWNYDINSWSGHYCTEDGDVLGFVFGTEGSEPKMFTVNISKVYVDGIKNIKASTGRGKIDGVFPGSNITLRMELENSYRGSTDINIGGVSITGTIEEIKNEDDITEEINDFDLKAGNKENRELEFYIPLDVEAKDRLLRIGIKAKDDAGIKYEEEFRYVLQIQKKEDDLRITKAELNKGSYECGENALLSFSIINAGAKEEDVGLSIVNKDLGLGIKENFKLSKNVFEGSSRYEKRFNVQIPSNLEKKNYPIEITANYGAEKETANVSLAVSRCGGNVVASSEEVKGDKEVTSIQTGELVSEEERTESEKGNETSETAVTQGRATKNLPLFLTAALAGLVVIIISLGVWFWVVRK